MRPGREKSAAMSSNVPPTTMPTRRKGRRMSQIERVEKECGEGEGPADDQEDAEEQEIEHRVSSPWRLTLGGRKKFRWVDDRSMADGGLQRVVAVDWSGDKGPGQRKKIWAGVWTASDLR